MPLRFPAPWRVDAPSDQCFRIVTAEGAPVAFVYFHVQRYIGTVPGDPLTKDQARRIAANIAKLPELLAKRD